MRKLIVVMPITLLVVAIWIMTLFVPEKAGAPPLFRGRTEKQMADRIGVYPADYYTAGSVTDGIQEAIDAANADGGGTVWLSAGDYTCDEDVTLYSNIILAGDGWDTVVASSSSTDIELSVDGGVATYNIEDVSAGEFIVDCSTSAEAGNISAYALISLDDSSTTKGRTYYHVVSSSATTGTVTLNSPLIYPLTETPTIRRYSTVKSNITIRDIRFSDVIVDLWDCNNINIKGCYFEDAGSASPPVIKYTRVYQGRVENCTFYDDGVLLILSDSQDIIVSKLNAEETNDQTGISISSSTGCYINNNHIRSDSYGISLTGTNYSGINGNIIHNGAVDCILVGTASDYNSVVGNVCYDGVIDNDGSNNVGASNVYTSCEGCAW